MIKEIIGEECLALRTLWERVFSEDSHEFTGYYFEEKAGRNRAFVLYPDTGEAEKERYSDTGDTEELITADLKREAPAAMLHLSPYVMELRVGDTFASLEINYIVGVATEAKYRHRGYMRELLKASMDYMYAGNQPFAFLMPASPKIYEPFQFVYIYDKKKYKVKVLALQETIRNSSSGHPRRPWETAVLQREEIPQLLHYASSRLKESYDVFIRRDEAYYDTLIKELEVQNGAIFLLRESEKRESCRLRETETQGEKITGYFLYTQEGQKTDIQEALFDDDYFCQQSGFLEEAGDKPIIMARILNVQAMLSLLRKKTSTACSEAGDKEDIILNIRIADPMLEGNNGIWQCSVGYREADIQRNRNVGAEVSCSTTIDSLTSWVFGYRPPEECFEIPQNEQKGDVLCKLNSIKLFSRVFINEIV
ncbi:putative acetyltransferase [Kineothrix alysoides]|uniref:Putative acetyltransferase n=1 Tax=Kineothrix alysoides TaxID=1469948 RepID=A0A4R1R0Y4_9FIRM|nr:GNAT family N-acetyltransferase [Kineothrix alysoides]TCL58949.1 putative acetyltransferase [Kineothrix alysoides]